jgi:hypothetical protein
MKPSDSIETGVIPAPLTVVESMVLMHTEVNPSIGKLPYALRLRASRISLEIMPLNARKCPENTQ